MGTRRTVGRVCAFGLWSRVRVCRREQSAGGTGYVAIGWLFRVVKYRVEIGRSCDGDGKELVVSVDVVEREDVVGCRRLGAPKNALVTTPIARPRDLEMHFINFNCMRFFITTGIGDSERQWLRVAWRFPSNECIPRCFPSLLPHTRPKRDTPRRVCLQH